MNPIESFVDWVRGPRISVSRIWAHYQDEIDISRSAKIRGWKNYKAWMEKTKAEMVAKGFTKDSFFADPDEVCQTCGRFLKGIPIASKRELERKQG